MQLNEITVNQVNTHKDKQMDSAMSVYTNRWIIKLTGDCKQCK